MIEGSAVVAATASLGPDVAIGAFAVVGEDVTVGAGCRLGSHVVVGAGCTIGAGSVLHSHAVLYAGVHLGERSVVQSGACIGPDGFGFAFDGAQWRKIPQVGGVVAGPDLRVGPNSTIDRGSVGDTRLGASCRVAELVQVGHNAVLGDSVVVGALSAVAGSAVIGNEVELGAQVAIAGHLTVGDGVRLMFQGGITQSTEAGEVVRGVPGRPYREARRAEKLLARVPSFVRRILALERAIRRGAETPAGPKESGD